MKSLMFTVIFSVGIVAIGFAQLRAGLSSSIGSLIGNTAFLDASSSTTWNSKVNDSKGLVFPRTDLTAISALIPTTSLPTNNPNKFDGMVVFNTATGTAAIGGTSVIPGFYYYRNTSATINGGKWVSMVPTVDYTLNTVTLTQNTTIDQSNSTVYCTGTFQLTLPVANTVAGKIFRIIKTDSDNSALTFSEDIYLTAVSKFNSLNYAKAFVIQSDGIKWTVVN